MTTAQFLDALRSILDGDALREAEALSAALPEPRELAAELVRRRRLTQPQVERLLGEVSADSPAEQIRAGEPMPMPGRSSFRETPHSFAATRAKPQAGGKGVWVLAVVLLVCLLACVPVVVVGGWILGLGFLVVANHDNAPAAVMMDAGPDAVARDDQPGDLGAMPFEPEMAPLQRFEGNTFRLSLDGNHILHGSAGKFFVSEIDSGKKLIELPAGRIPIGFTRDKPLEVASGGAGEIMPVILNDGVTGQEMKLCPGVHGPITRMRMLPDGDMALFLRGADLIIYNFAAVKEPAPLLTLPEEPTDLAVSSDGFSYLTGSDTGRVQLRSLKNDGKIVDYPGALFGINCVALSPNGKHVLACCEQSVLVWERDNPEKRISFDHDGAVLCAAFSPDGRRILSGGKRGHLRLSNADDGELIAQFRHGIEMTALAFHPDGRRAISASKDKMVRVWNLPK